MVEAKRGALSRDSEEIAFNWSRGEKRVFLKGAKQKKEGGQIN